MITKTAKKFIKKAGFGVGAGLALYSGAVGAHTGYDKARELRGGEASLLRNEYGLDRDADLELRNAGRGALGGLIGSLPGALAMGSKRLGAVGKAVGAIGALGGGAIGSYIASGKYSPDGAEFVQDMRDNVTPEQIQAWNIPRNAKKQLARYYDYDPDLVR